MFVPLGGLRLLRCTVISTELVAIVLMVLAVPILVTAFFAWFVVLGPHIAGRPTGVREIQVPPPMVHQPWHRDLPVVPAAFELPRYQARSSHPVAISTYADVEIVRDALDPWRSSVYALTGTVQSRTPQTVPPRRDRQVMRPSPQSA
jgi:hypothetical protein